MPNLKMDKSNELPSPLQFDKYLPYACYQMGIDLTVIITAEARKIYEPVSARPKFSSKVMIKEPSDNLESFVKFKSFASTVFEGPNCVKLKTMYDSITDDLIEIKFLKNNEVPDIVFRVISLIVKFYPRLTSIVIDKGLNQQGIYELSKLISESNITDVILDDNRIPEANYYVLFDVTSTLNYLSLSRCSLNDLAIEKLMSKIQKSSLTILSLSSNLITDKGAIIIGNFLRQNRKLLYLNLADNMITDEGASSILNSLMTFRLTAEEIFEKRFKYYISDDKYFELTEEISNNDESNKKTGTTKKMKAHSAEPTTVSQPCNLSANENIEAFAEQNLLLEDGGLYCNGNNILCYLNLAYNNLGYFSMKKLLEVLSFQEKEKRIPKGLIWVCIEGNNMPSACKELMEIRYIFADNLSSFTRETGRDTKRKTNR